MVTENLIREFWQLDRASQEERLLGCDEQTLRAMVIDLLQSLRDKDICDRASFDPQTGKGEGIQRRSTIESRDLSSDVLSMRTRIVRLPKVPHVRPRPS